MHTRDLDEAIAAVQDVYCRHRIDVMDARRPIDVCLVVSRPSTQPLVQLSYGVPVKVDAGDFPRLFLMMHCARGAARTCQGGREAEWRAGRTLPFSAGFETQLWFNAEFVQRAVRIDVDTLETLCARWLGYPLPQPLRFSLQTFAVDFEHAWWRALQYIWSFESNVSPLPGAARSSLDEHLLALLLHRHPHNFREDLFKRESTPDPGLIRRAERYIDEHAHLPLTVSDVAAGLGVGVRTLQQGFKTWRNTTPLGHLRQVRLQRVREQLLRKEERTSIAQVALQHGFSHFGRFSAYYRQAFGENPSVTWRRSRFNGR